MPFRQMLKHGPNQGVPVQPLLLNENILHTKERGELERALLLFCRFVHNKDLRKGQDSSMKYNNTKPFPLAIDKTRENVSFRL
jgi:hypothetical protein